MNSKYCNSKREVGFPAISWDCCPAAAFSEASKSAAKTGIGTGNYHFGAISYIPTWTTVSVEHDSKVMKSAVYSSYKADLGLMHGVVCAVMEGYKL